MSNADGKTHVEAVMDALEGMASPYSLAKEFFSFDSTPDSVQDKSYRMEVNRDFSEDETGRTRRYLTINVFTANHLPAGDNQAARKTTFLNIVDEQDKVEDAITISISNFKIWHESTTMQEAFNGLYIVNHFVFRVQFWRCI